MTPAAIKRYERITYREEGASRSRSAYAEVLADLGALLLLRPVNKEGEDQSFYSAEGVLVDRQWLLDKALVTKRVRLRMNRTYGEFEPDVEDDQ